MSAPVKARDVLLVLARVVAPSVAEEAAGAVDEPSAGAVDEPSAGLVTTVGQETKLLQVTALVTDCAPAVAAVPSAAADSTPSDIATLIRVFLTLGSFHQVIVQYDHSQRLCKQGWQLAASILRGLRTQPPLVVAKMLGVGEEGTTFGGLTNARGVRRHR
jgi:hypothetical protein